MKYVSRYLYALAACLFLSGVVACEAKKPSSNEQLNPTEPRDCDQPSRDDQGRPIPLC
jgi:hypothetical protein